MDARDAARAAAACGAAAAAAPGLGLLVLVESASRAVSQPGSSSSPPFSAIRATQRQRRRSRSISAVSLASSSTWHFGGCTTECTWGTSGREGATEWRMTDWSIAVSALASSSIDRRSRLPADGGGRMNGVVRFFVGDSQKRTSSGVALLRDAHVVSSVKLGETMDLRTRDACMLSRRGDGSSSR